MPKRNVAMTNVTTQVLTRKNVSKAQEEIKLFITKIEKSLKSELT
jgi:hypothetical protein